MSEENELAAVEAEKETPKIRYGEIIEVNARFGGASTASIAVGLDVWYWSLLDFFGADDQNQYIFKRLKSDIRQIRHLTDIYINDFNL